VLDPIVKVLASALQVLHGLSGSYLLAIVLLTAGIRLVLHPLTRKSLKATKAMQLLAPQMQVLRRKYKDDPRQLNIEVMNLYRANKVNPLGGCLPQLVQLPILFALYAMLRQVGFGGETLFGIPLGNAPTFPRDFVTHPLLALIPLLIALTTYWQQAMLSSVSMTDPQQARTMLIIMPLMLTWFSVKFPIGLSVYWIASTVLYVVEYYIVVGPPKGGREAPPREQRNAAKALKTPGSQEAPRA
jgi:YidC/Oxa1 family membrane protein insertase